MDTTAIALLGQQLTDFLVKQFAPPPGTKTSLGFLGTGVAVDPNSFLSGGQFNPARVNQWLNIVVDPLGEVITSSDQVEFTPWTATMLLEAIYSQALSLEPAGSDAQHGFAKAKSQAMEGLGGATTVNTAPLDWYDPARVPQWPDCSMTASSTTSTGTTTGTGDPAPDKPLWAWRRLEMLHIQNPTANVESVPTAEADGTAMRAINTVQDRRFAFAATPGAAVSEVASPVLNLTDNVASVAAPESGGLTMSAVTGNAFNVSAVQTRRVAFAATPREAVSEMASPIMMARLAPLGQAARTAQTVQVSGAESMVSINRIPSRAISEQAITPIQALRVSQAVSTAANQATTSSVASNSLTLHLKYLVVSLSRAPWWNEFLMLLDNWYIPGCARASMIEDSHADKIIGVPIALILTSDVRIQAIWSDADRAAATSHTHLGPWPLNSAQFKVTSEAGEATLAIPGMQAIACIYRQLPALPPKPDPNLSVPAADPSPSPATP